MDTTLADLVARAASGAQVAYGVHPVAAYLGARLAGDRPVVVVCADERAAGRLAHDIRFFLRGGDIVELPAVDTSPYADLTPDRAGMLRRMATLYRLARRDPSVAVVVASAPALLRRAMPPAELLELTDTLAAGREVDRDRLADLLHRAGYARVPVVEDPGTYAVRGGVVDLFPPDQPFPVRAELDGDLVDSLRSFDPGSQRTLRPLDQVHIVPVRETVHTRGADPRPRVLAAADAAAHPSKETRRILDHIAEGTEFLGIDTLTPAFHAEMVPPWQYLPEPATWLVLDPDAIAQAATDELESAHARYQDRLDAHKIAFPPADHYADPQALMEALRRPAHRIEAPRLEMADRPQGAGADGRVEAPLRLIVDDNRLLRAELERARRQKADALVRPLVDALVRWRELGWRVGLVCESASRADGLAALLARYDVGAIQSEQGGLEQLEPQAPTILRGALADGFALPAERLALLTEDDIFGERRHDADRARKQAAARRARAALFGGVSDFSQLEPGDYLVHSLHGVGLYRGLVKLPPSAGRARRMQMPGDPPDSGGSPGDFLHLEYGGGTLYLPVYRLNEVQRYVGAEGHKPRLDRLGGATWDKARRKVRADVRHLAEELLQIYAQRAALPGHTYPPADEMFHEFEATFPFDETPDQQKAIDDVLADMESGKPMDRLVCGDVGYGKTEIALRAALKAVLGGKQVGILAPTTVLVEQHFRTMTERYAGWPVRVARLSRFQGKKEQVATVRGLAEGTIDIVVGTHRLLSADVRFKELGLVIIDEEQRFGVAHKERLKKLRTQVDVLTLTATPIPRTLHLAMTGLRDLSIIATPPADRRSIRTFVAREEDAVIREALRRELARGGQAFLVSPRIVGQGDVPTKGGAARVRTGDRSLEEWAVHLRELVPEARVAVAHGQMPEAQLEKVMVQFVDGEHDVLCCTTIVESGLDIPRANTMFIARADMLGLAQLYQLRGRIGRSKERAFCYLLVPPSGKLTEEARLRLEVLQRFTELGAGFQIASHDLEIRGAGELLGREQSGSIASIGFDAYTRMLEEAVAELRGEPITTERDPELTVEVPGYIPDDYAPDTGQRLDLYKRLAGAADEDEVAEIMDEIGDRYGPAPLEVHRLADISILRAHARRLGAQSLELTGTRMVLAFGPDARLRPEAVVDIVRRGDGWRLTPDMRLERRFDDDGRRQVTATARRSLLDLLACAT